MRVVILVGLRIRMQRRAQFFASHATREQAGPHLCYRFSKAVVMFHQGDGHMTVRYVDGTTIGLMTCRTIRLQICCLLRMRQTAVLGALPQRRRQLFKLLISSIQTFRRMAEQPTDDGYLCEEFGEEMLQAFRNIDAHSINRSFGRTGSAVEVWDDTASGEGGVVRRQRASASQCQ